MRWHPLSIAASFTTAGLCKQPRFPPVDKWLERLRDIYTRGAARPYKE